ncbi:MAG: PLP-dependent transferase [Rhodospirillaceae bacterium]|jgi:cystathionine gamma-synthase|nr:PLP-dependent transferase [Rhodospirillaceae bacterium]MBT5195193.1 PLP-dependent transferase [Rhodospirillaceae bacterium]MBT6430923.1 PLP-dependent transferase [Rhodospirillaceae bacterium]
MTSDENWSRRSQAARALGWVDQSTRAVTPPIHPASTFLRDPDNQYSSGYSYARDTNPTYDQAEALLCELEGGAAAMLFASGMAAAGAVFLNLAPGDHVLAPRVMYWGLRKWLMDFAVPWGLVVDFIDMGDLVAIKAALRPGQSRLIWIETPANPLWGISDIAAIAALAHGVGARLAVDSTVATPVLSQPLILGADVVMHSATKYLNGHSDMIGGALVASQRDEFWQGLADIRHDGGAVLGAFEAWLLLRGMRTLYPRVEAACRNAQAVAEHFHDHAEIVEVLYPGLPSAPDHALAARQMRGGFGGMLSLRVRGGEARAIEVAANVKLWSRATSLGGVESLIEHRASVEGPDTPVPGDLLRLSCGIEDAKDLIADLERALAIGIS